MKYIIISGLKTAEKADYSEMVLIPKPQEIVNLNFQIAFRLSSKNNISFVNCKQKHLLFNNLMEYNTQYFDITFQKTKEEFDPTLLNHYDSKRLLNTGEGAYNLEICDNIIIIYSLHERGLFYGVQTLIQILKNAQLSVRYRKNKGFTIPEISIKDAPDLGIRGVAQDISRGQVCTVESAKRYIKILSHYKMNFYCLYMEDMFAHPKHPLIGKERGAFSCEEIREIDAFARQHFIELIPIFECLGHFDNILQHKQYWHLGEFPGAHALDISNPEIYSFLTDYISEISKCFSTKYFHIGCDESFDVGNGSSQEFIKKVGQSKALFEFYNKIYKITRQQGNERVIMYDDIVRKDELIMEGLNKEMILMYWDYAPEIKNPPISQFVKAGYKVIVSPAMLNWNRNFPDNKNAGQNITNMIDLAHNYSHEGCLGVLTSTWGDQRYFSLRENEIFGAVLSAGKAWNVQNFDYSQFKKEFGFLFYGIEKPSLSEFNKMFTILSSSARCYYRLRLLLPPLFYTDFFKHPFLSPKFKPGLKNYKDLQSIGERSLKLYDKLVHKVTYENENFEYIQFGAELAKYCGEKIAISVKIADQLRKCNNFQEQLQELIERIKYIRDKVFYLKGKYEILWLRAAKRPCLDYNLRLFDSLIKAYNDKIAQLRKNISFKTPFLNSEWIWIDEKICPQKPRFFRRVIQVDKSIKSAMLQGTVCNHMKIFINEEPIGEVLGRFSLSRIPIINRVKVLDITEQLKQGKNIIAIEAYSYDGFKAAFNLFGQIKLEDDSVIEFITDESWSCATENMITGNAWRALDYDDKDWECVKSYGTPPNLNGDLVKPDLFEGEISITQDYFGAQGYYYTAIGIFFGKVKKFILRRLIGLIIKIGRLYG